MEIMEQRTMDAEKAIKAQRDYLIELSKKDNTWMRDTFAKGEGFAPKDGRCYVCKKQIYADVEVQRRNWKTGEIETVTSQGISVEKASNELTTGCPHCYHSFVE